MNKNNTSIFDIEALPKEMKLMLLMLSSEHPEELEEKHRDLLEQTDWNLFIELARHHRVFPTLNKKLQDMESTIIPTFVISLFKRDYSRNTFLMLALSGEIEQLAKQMGRMGIRTLFLKGPVIAADLYGDVSLRTSSDLDILIPIEKLDEAEQLLISHGYEKDDYIVSVLNDWRWRHHHTSFKHPKTGVKVELHWRLNPGPAREPSFDELWERRQQSSLINHPVYYLGREDLFMFLVTHGARHGWSRLRWILDIKQLVKQSMNWSVLEQLMEKYHYTHLAGQALLLIHKLLAESLRQEMKSMTDRRQAQKLANGTLFYLERMVNLHSIPLPEDVENYHKRYAIQMLSLRHKWLYLLSLMHPFPEDIDTLPLPKPLHILYFPLRPFLWAWRKLN